MMSTIDNFLIDAQCRMTMAKENFKRGFQEFWTGERGVSNVVAMIIILLIVVLVIGVFWDSLQVWLQDMMETIFGKKIKNDTLKGVGI